MPIDTYPHPTSPAVTASMKANRRADTKPEVSVRSALHARGLRFRKDLLLRTKGGLRTKADIVFPRVRIAVFVDGCFWHGCPLHGSTPKSNSHYWGPKLKRNKERDATVNRALGLDGWQVIRVWEHEPVEEVVQKVADAVASAAARYSARRVSPRGPWPLRAPRRGRSAGLRDRGCSRAGRRSRSG